MAEHPPGPAIRVEDLGKRFLIGTEQKKESFPNTTRRLLTGWTQQRELWALRHIGFEVARGEALGIIGPNGAGKSTLLLLLSQILAPTEGRVQVSGRTNCFFRLGAALHSGLSVQDNFSLCSALLGLNRSQFREKFPAMLAFSELEDYLHAKYGELSSGLAARLPFAAAVHTEIDILLVDEMLMVGDAAFQAKCLKTFRNFQAQGKTLVVVSHSLQLIQSLCPQTLYINAGKQIFLGNSATAARMLMRDLGVSGAGAKPIEEDIPRPQDDKAVAARTARLAGPSPSLEHTESRPETPFVPPPAPPIEITAAQQDDKAAADERVARLAESIRTMVATEVRGILPDWKSALEGLRRTWLQAVRETPPASSPERTEPRPEMPSVPPPASPEITAAQVERN